MADNELTLDVGQANEFKLACRKSGYTNSDIKRMCEGDLLARILPFIRGQAEIEPVKNLIDCAAPATVPNGCTWTVEYHDTSLGQFELDMSKIELYLSCKQQCNSLIEGHKLRKELKVKKVLNANVLDDWLADNRHIPENIRVACQEQGKIVFFWGTVFRGLGGSLYVRFLCWNSCGWDWNHRCLDRVWDSRYPALILESN